jgi:hypothetical protein
MVLKKNPILIGKAILRIWFGIDPSESGSDFMARDSFNVQATLPT